VSRKLTAVAALAVAAVTLAAVAAAAPVAAPVGAKQRVSIQVTGAGDGRFALTSLTAGAVKSDTGIATFCCWTQRLTTRDGQMIVINNPRMTLTSKRGTIVARNQVGWIDIPNGWAVFTGTWKVVRGTGAYAGLAGGGRGAGVMLVNGDTRATFDGFLNQK
jgi:hypothetical protein